MRQKDRNQDTRIVIVFCFCSGSCLLCQLTASSWTGRRQDAGRKKRSTVCLRTSPCPRNHHNLLEMFINSWKINKWRREKGGSLDEVYFSEMLQLTSAPWGRSAHHTRRCTTGKAEQLNVQNLQNKVYLLIMVEFKNLKTNDHYCVWWIHLVRFFRYLRHVLFDFLSDKTSSVWTRRWKVKSVGFRFGRLGQVGAGGCFGLVSGQDRSWRHFMEMSDRTIWLWRVVRLKTGLVWTAVAL